MCVEEKETIYELLRKYGGTELLCPLSSEPQNTITVNSLKTLNIGVLGSYCLPTKESIRSYDSYVDRYFWAMGYRLP